MSSIADNKKIDLTPEEANRILDAWANKGIFRKKSFLHNLEIKELKTHSFFRVQFDSQYEARQIVIESEPFAGGIIDDKEREPSIWEIKVSQPTDFGNKADSVKIPHSESVTTCGNCSGKGEVSCSHCSGSGRTSCFSCGGAGRITRYQQKSEYDYYSKQTVFKTETVYESCFSCGGMGRVSCSSCGGNGKQQCQSCRGYGQIKSFKVLSVQFTHRKWMDFINTSDLPSKKLQKATGSVMFKERHPLIQNLTGAHPSIMSRLNTMASEASSNEDTQIRILFQSALAEEIIGYELSCVWKGTKEKIIWIYGNESRVFVKGISFLAWWKVALALLGVTGIIALFSYLILQS